MNEAVWHCGLPVVGEAVEETGYRLFEPFKSHYWLKNAKNNKEQKSSLQNLQQKKYRYHGTKIYQTWWNKHYITNAYTALLMRRSCSKWCTRQYNWQNSAALTLKKFKTQQMLKTLLKMQYFITKYLIRDKWHAISKLLFRARMMQIPHTIY